MILGKKGLKGQAPLCKAELDALFASGEELSKALEEGHPASAPAAVPAAVLARTIATLQLYNALAARLATVEDGLEHPVLIERLEALQKEAKELVSVAPPVVKPASRLVVPGR